MSLSIKLDDTYDTKFRSYLLNYVREKLLDVVSQNDFTVEGHILGKSNSEMKSSLDQFVRSYMITREGVLESGWDSFEVRLIEYGCMTKRPRRLFSSVIDDVRGNLDSIYNSWLRSEIL